MAVRLPRRQPAPSPSWSRAITVAIDAVVLAPPEWETRGGDLGFFGHPKGLGFMLGAEVGYSFAYFGLLSMLTLYMTQTLLRPGHVEHVWGFSAFTGLLRGLYGPSTPLGVASHIFGLSQSMLSTLPLLGGVIADRWLGQRRSVMIGMLVLTAAFGLLVFEATFLVALALMTVGVGLVKTCFVGQLGRLYAADDPRRTRGFGIWLIAMNIGSMSQPLIAGTVGERLGWNYGLMVLAVSMALGAMIYGLGLRYLPVDRTRGRHVGGAEKPARLSRRDWRIIATVLLVAVLTATYGASYGQAWNVFPVWAATHVERHIGTFQMPVTWFFTLDGVFSILGIALAVRLWAREDRSGKPPNELRRLTIGAAITACAFLVLAGGAWLGRPGGGLGMTPLSAAVGFFLLVDFALPWMETVGMTLITRDSPAPVNTTMIGISFLIAGVGAFVTGWLGGFADKLPSSVFWLMHAAIPGAALLSLLLFGGAMRRGLRGEA